MKQNNCFIYTSKLSQSNRKSIKDSCVQKQHNDLFITFSQSDSFEKVEADFNNIPGNSSTLYKFKKKFFSSLISFVSVIVILFALLSVSIYEDLFKKILFEFPFEWSLNDGISLFFILIFIFGLLMMPSILDGESNEFRSMIYTWFNKDAKKVKRLKLAIENFDKKCTIHLFNFDLVNSEHWLWKILFKVIVNKFHTVKIYVRNDQLQNTLNKLKEFDLLNIEVEKDKKELNKVQTEVIFSQKEKKLNSLLQLCSTKIINDDKPKEFISLELFEFCGNSFIKQEEQSNQLIFGFQNFINRGFYDFNLLKQEKSLQLCFSSAYSFEDLKEDEKRLAFYLRNHIEQCVKTFENPISLLVLYYYVKNIVLDEKRLILIIERLILTISAKQQYELVSQYWFNIAGEMFDCSEIENFDKNEKSFYRKVSVEALVTLSGLFERNGFFNQAILINKYLYELNPNKYAVNICSLYERMGEFELALSSLPKQENLSHDEKPSDTQIRFLQRKSWIIVSQRNLELKDDGLKALDEMSSLLSNHNDDNEPIWLWHYYNIKANYEEWNENYDCAVKNYEKCLSIPTLGSFEYGATFVNMAIAYRFKFIQNEFKSIEFINKAISLGNIGMNLKKSVGDRDEMPIVIHNQVLNILYKLLVDKFDEKLCLNAFELSCEAIDILDTTASKKRLGMLLIENYISAYLLKKDNINTCNKLKAHIDLVDENELKQLLNVYKQFRKTNKITHLDYLDVKL